MITPYDILQFIAWSALLGFAAVLIFLWWITFKIAKPGHRWWVGSLLTATFVGAIFLFMAAKYREWTIEQQEKEQRIAARNAAYEEAKAVFDHLCATEGKEEIFQTASNVEGVTLLNIWGDKYGNDYVAEANAQMQNTWEYAGLPQQLKERGYIEGFLRWHFAEFSSPQSQWPYYSFTVHKDYVPDEVEKMKKKNIIYKLMPAYSLIDVKNKDETYNRYYLRNSDDDPLVLVNTTKKPFRYAVHFENPIIDDERKYWIARTIVIIYDLETNTVMAKKTWFSFESRLGERGYDGYMMWSLARTCPKTSEAHSELDSIFHFSRKVLTPAEERNYENQ